VICETPKDSEKGETLARDVTVIKGGGEKSPLAGGGEEPHVDQGGERRGRARGSRSLQ